MKKILIILLIIVVAGSAFAQRRRDAQVNFRGGVDMVFVPFQYINSELPDGTQKDFFGMGMGRYADNGRNAMGRLYYDGQFDNMGLYLRFQAEVTGNVDTPGFPVGGVNVNDNRVSWGFASIGVWYQPFTFIRFDMGKFRNTDLRGKINSPWCDAFTVGGYDGDEIFSPLRSWTQTNAWGSTPGGPERNDFGALSAFKWGKISAYLMFAGLWPTDMRLGTWYYANGSGNNGYPENNTMEVYDRSTGRGDLMRTLERTQVAFGYSIPNVGLARIQYLGANLSPGYTNGFLDTSLIDNEVTQYNVPRIEAALNLNQIAHLNLDIGVKYHLPWEALNVKTWDTTNYEWNNRAAADRNAKGILQKSIQVSVGAAYNLDKININGRVDGRFGGTYDYQDDTEIVKLPIELNCHLWPTYDLANSLVGLDIGVEWLGEKTQGDVVVLDGGLRFGGGFWIERRWASCTMRTGAFFRAPDNFNSIREDMVFTIPISFNYTF